MTELAFKDKIALVTGSGRGIGRAIALRLAEMGADVVINYHRNEGPANDAAAQVREMGRRALVVRANLSKPEDIDLLFDNVEKEFGGLDFFISNAASGFNRPAMQQKVTGWDWTMDVNARAFLFAAQRAVPLMEKRGGGRMVTITSPGSQRVLPDYVAVGASKAALEALTRYLAVELSPRNIVVNAVSPGLVLTDIVTAFRLAERSRDDPQCGEKHSRGTVGHPRGHRRGGGFPVLPGGVHDPRAGDRHRRRLITDSPPAGFKDLLQELLALLGGHRARAGVVLQHGGQQGGAEVFAVVEDVAVEEFAAGAHHGHVHLVEKQVAQPVMDQACRLAGRTPGGNGTGCR